MEDILRIIFILAIGFICLAYPMLLLLYIWNLPIYAIVAYFAWIFISIISVVLSKEEKKLNKMTVSFESTFIFTIILIFVISNNYGNYKFTTKLLFDDNKLYLYISPALSLPLIYFVGSKILLWKNERENKKRNDYIQKVKSEIKINLNDIDLLKSKLNCKQKIITLLTLLKKLGADTGDFENNPEIKNINQIVNDIKEKRNKISELEKEISKMEER